jgi:hypothetical protein
MVAISATTGFIANYIEEMQLLPYRVFAHKYLSKKEHINIVKSKEFKEPIFIKGLKVFRMQIFLFYYFTFAIFLNSFFQNMVFYFVCFALIGTIIYSIAQLYNMMKYEFDAEIEALDIILKGE